MIVAAVETTAAPTAGRSSFGSSTAREPIVATVAVLDTNPDMKPLSRSPNRGPMIRNATYPAPCTAIMITTSRQTTNGFKRIIYIDALVGHQRQDDQRGGRHQQAVVDLLLGEGLAHQVVNALPVGEHERHPHRQRRRRGRVLRGKRPEQEGDHQRDLGRYSRVVPSLSR